MTTTTPFILSALQLRNARLLMGWSRDRLAPLVGTSTNTLGKLERSETGGFDAVLAQARSIFEDAGFEFIEGGAPGLRFRTPPVRPLNDERR